MTLCSICKNTPLMRYVDLSPEMTAEGLSRYAAETGMDVSADRIRTHRKHLAAEMPVREQGTRKRDFAVVIRDRMEAAVNQLPQGGDIDPVTGRIILDPILDKEFAPAINAGIKAQAVIDKREQAAKKQTQADVLLSLLAALRGEGRPEPPRQLDDGMTVEGTAIEVN